MNQTGELQSTDQLSIAKPSSTSNTYLLRNLNETNLERAMKFPEPGFFIMFKSRHNYNGRE